MSCSSVIIDGDHNSPTYLPNRCLAGWLGGGGDTFNILFLALCIISLKYARVMYLITEVIIFASLTWQ